MAQPKVTRLPALHSATVEAYFRALKGEPLVDANGTPILDEQGQIQWKPPSPALLKAVNEFLKNNGIDREPIDGSGLPELRKLSKFDDEPILELEAPDEA